MQLIELALQLTRFAAGGERGKGQVLGCFALPATPCEIERARDLARRHGPYVGRRIVGPDQGVDGFGDVESGAVAD